jgi:hypothetical protein
MYSKELACHQLARKLLIQDLRDQYQRRAAIAFERPQNFVSKLFQIYFDPKMRRDIPAAEWRRMKLFAPLLWLMFMVFWVLFILALSWDYYEFRRNRRQALNALEQKILALNRESLQTNSPRRKSIDALWEPYSGIDVDLETMIALLNQWIGLLYPDEVAKLVDVAALSQSIIDQRIKANSRYYRGEKGASHFYFIPLNEALVRSISKLLPCYKLE